METSNSVLSATNTKQTIRKAVAWTALALAATSAQAIDLRSWDKKINKASERFRVVLDGQGVLDTETALVWERSPSTEVTDWRTASVSCAAAIIGGRQGWRMPTVDEAHSLRDPSRATNLPAGHPFVGIEGGYWTATSDFDDEFRALVVGFGIGGGITVAIKTIDFPVWCVRGAGGRVL